MLRLLARPAVATGKTMALAPGPFRRFSGQ